MTPRQINWCFQMRRRIKWYHDRDGDEGRHSLIDIVPVNLGDVDHHESACQDQGRAGAIHRNARCTPTDYPSAQYARNARPDTFK